jgi:hypothetical protein
VDGARAGVGAADARRALHGLLLSLLHELGQLLIVYIVEPLARELIGTFERNAAFVLVRVDALQIRIAPGGRTRRVRFARFGSAFCSGPLSGRGGGEERRRRKSHRHQAYGNGNQSPPHLTLLPGNGPNDCGKRTVGIQRRGRIP